MQARNRDLGKRQEQLHRELLLLLLPPLIQMPVLMMMMPLPLALPKREGCPDHGHTFQDKEPTHQQHTFSPDSLWELPTTSQAGPGGDIISRI